MLRPPPRTIGRVNQLSLRSASNGLIEGPYSSPVHFVDQEVSINKEHGNLREKDKQILKFMEYLNILIILIQTILCVRWVSQILRN